MTPHKAAAALLLTPALALFGQSAPSTDAPSHMTRSQRADLEEAAPVTFFPLHYATSSNDADELLTAARLMVPPSVKLYLDVRQSTIIMRGLPDEVAIVNKLISELDRPRPSYRLTYTLTDYDGTRKLGSSDYTMTLLEGQRTVMRQGARVPVLTSKTEDGSNSQAQYTYVDIGLNFDATASSNLTGAVVREKIERSAEPQPPAAPGLNPTFHQTLLENVEDIPLGRTVPLGTLDSDGPDRRTEVSARLEKLP